MRTYPTIHPHMNTYEIEACVEEYLFQVDFMNRRTTNAGRVIAARSINEFMQQIEDAGALPVFNHLLAKAVAR